MVFGGSRRTCRGHFAHSMGVGGQQRSHSVQSRMRYSHQIFAPHSRLKPLVVTQKRVSHILCLALIIHLTTTYPTGSDTMDWLISHRLPSRSAKCDVRCPQGWLVGGRRNVTP